MKEPVPKKIQGRNQHGQDIGILHPGLAYNIQFSALFKFAYFCDTEDGQCDCSTRLRANSEAFPSSHRNIAFGNLGSRVVCACVAGGLRTSAAILRPYSGEPAWRKGHLCCLPHGDWAALLYFALINAYLPQSLNARRKLATHTLYVPSFHLDVLMTNLSSHPDIDRPLEALRHYRAAMETDKQRAIKYNNWTDSWQLNPWVLYAAQSAL